MKVDIINLNEYERIDPSRLLNQRGEYYTNGTNNEFFYRCESMFLSSPTNNAIIKKYTNLILGDGIVSDDPKFAKKFKKKELRMFVQDYKIHGNAALRIFYDYNGDIAKVEHVPTRCLAVNIEDDIMDDPTGYWYSFDWNSKNRYKPSFVPAFNSLYADDETKLYEIAYLKSPSPQPIFSLPDWFSGIQYCEMEMEMSNFFINHIKTGFSGATIININKGNTIKEGEDEKIKKGITKKLTGTSGDRVIVSINDNKENQTTVENLSIVDAYQQFDFVESSTREKIMMAHAVNDPDLFGIPSTTGFASDSEKKIQSRKDLYRDVINPMREEILDFLEDIFPDTKMEFKDFEEFNESDTESSEGLKVEMDDKKKVESVDTENIRKFIDECGEDIDLSKWRLVEDMDEEFEVIEMVDTGIARPNAKSSQDFDDVYKIRYRYDGNKSPEREFCKMMMAADKIYRKEDIENMYLSNPDFSPYGLKGGYDIWRYKGGVACKHFWRREIYVNKDRTKGVDPNNPNSKIISPSKMIKESGNVPEVNDPLVYQTPHSMPNMARLSKR